MESKKITQTKLRDQSEKMFKINTHTHTTLDIYVTHQFWLSDAFVSCVQLCEIYILTTLQPYLHRLISCFIDRIEINSCFASILLIHSISCCSNQKNIVYVGFISNQCDIKCIFCTFQKWSHNASKYITLIFQWNYRI